jgi:Tol biopolymer transport system component
VGLVSPDGSHIVYTEFTGGHSTIWVRPVDGGASRQLTSDGFENLPALSAEQVWSTDGREFLFVSTRTGKADIWVGTTEGTVRQLTTDINSDNNPSFSPDGKWVAFHSDRGRQGDIWVVPTAGGEAIRITDDLVQEEQVRWIGPTTLTYLAANSPAALWRRRLDDQTETRLTPDSLDPGGFWTNRDRSRIAFLIDRPGASNDLAVMDLSSGDVRIVSRDAQHQNIFWDQSGTQLAFNADQAGSLDVYVVSVASDSAPRRLVDWPGFEQVIGWSPDGRHVDFVSERESRLGDLWQAPLDGGPPVRRTRFGSVVGGLSTVQAGKPRTFLFTPDSASGEIVLQELLGNGALRRVLGGNPGGIFASPDGELLATQVAAEGGARGVVIDLNGKVVQQLGAGAFAQSFSADGNRVLFNARRGNSIDVMIMDLATGASEQVTSTPGDETHAEFSADETSIVLRRVQITRRIMRADLSTLLPR